MVPGGHDEIVYGRHAVLEALRAGHDLEAVLVAEGGAHRGTLGDLIAAARDAGVPLKWMPRKALDRVVAERIRSRGGPSAPQHQGVVAFASGFRYADVNEILALAIKRGEPPLVLVLDAVQDVHNLGTLLRTAEAVGAHGAVLADRHAVGVTPAVRKASAGAVAHLTVSRSELASALDTLRAHDVRIVGLDESAVDRYDEADLSGPIALVVGSEGRGLSPAVARRCDVAVRLPMRGHTGSLNAGVAGSIVLYEALRQREPSAS